MSDTVEQIKSRLDIVDVVSGYLKVQKAGANYKARCPFHTEKTPSFYISPERQSWHCFGCNKGGDMFSFVQEIDGVEFLDALRTLADRAGVQIRQSLTERGVQADVSRPLLAIAELSAKFFEKQLWHGAAGSRALAYLHGRGMTDETIRAWRLGWAPNDWRSLTTFLAGQNCEHRDIVAAGVAVEKEPPSVGMHGRVYDRFRSRIMFPICDAGGRVVGFTGRVFGTEVAIDGEPLAKYVNTPQTAIYNKSAVLFGLDKARTTLRQRDEGVLVEGNVDAIMASQAGVTNVVATSGTALTHQQLRRLARYSMNLTVCFDADRAGRTAMRRCIGLALSNGMQVKIMTLDDPACKDPADYVAAYGSRLAERVAVAKPAIQHYYDEAAESLDLSSVQSKKAVVASVCPLIKHLSSRVEQSHWIWQLAALLRVDMQSVAADMATVRDDIVAIEYGAKEPVVVAGNHAEELPVDPASQELLGLVAAHPELLPSAKACDQASLDQRVRELLDNPERLTPDASHEHRHMVDVAYMRARELWRGWEIERLRAHVSRIGAGLEMRRLRQENSALASQIQQSEIEKDIPHRDALIGQFQKNNQRINNLQDTLNTIS